MNKDVTMELIELREAAEKLNCAILRIDSGDKDYTRIDNCISSVETAIEHYREVRNG